MTGTTTRTRAEVGRANRRRGAETERKLAAYLRRVGWRHAERKSDTGFRTSTRVDNDRGDIRGTEMLCWQAKSSASLSDQDIQAALDQTADQTVAAGADFGFLVVRRERKSDPANWWVWLTGADLYALVEQTRGVTTDLRVMERDEMQHPVRLRLGDLVPLLHDAGYGERVGM